MPQPTKEVTMTGKNENVLRLFDPSKIPMGLTTDSYKQSHPSAYPSCDEAGAYIEARAGFLNDKKDQRLVVNGVRYFVERFLARRWREEDVSEAAELLETFCPGGTKHPFPEDLFRKFIASKSEGGNDGYFPVRVRALRDGEAILARTPMFVFEASREYARLVTWLETLALQSVWYMSTVATLSRRVRDVIDAAFERSVDPEMDFLRDSRLHDFGMRGCTSLEQTMMGGSAHLLSFDGSDTLSAVWYVRKWLAGEGIGSSVAATEHTLMMSHKTELAAVRKMIELYGHTLFATVADTYDYTKFLNEVLPAVAAEVRDKGGFHVVRPDSGDPVECVIEGLYALERAYGADTNSKGYKVIRGAGVIQGDGIDHVVLERILEAVMAEGFSAQNVAFGMGGGLLQKVDRDTLRFACKISYRVVDGIEIPLMKDPLTDPEKRSQPGRLAAVKQDGVYRSLPYELLEDGEYDALELVYDCGPCDYVFEDFHAQRARLNATWAELRPVKSERGIGPEMTRKMERVSRR